MMLPPVHIAHWKPCKSYVRFSDSQSAVSHPRTCYDLHWTIRRPAQKRRVQTSTCYSRVMLVSWYATAGLMADGTHTYPGAAAGGYDLPIGAKVTVPGVGRLTVHDRIGFAPYAHIDVFVSGAAQAQAMGLGADYRRVTVCR